MRIKWQKIVYLKLTIILPLIAGCGLGLGKDRSPPPPPPPPPPPHMTCAKYDGKESLCNSVFVNGKPCIFDKSNNTCVTQKVDCGTLNSDKDGCAKALGCEYFAHWRHPSKSVCLNSRDIEGQKNKECDVTLTNYCELDGFAKERCVYRNRCEPRSNYDARGFDTNDFHLSGRYNEDDNGFNRRGEYVANGWPYSQYDPQGYDLYGFNAAGIHRDTGTAIGPTGFDRFGYNLAGFDASGLDRDGRDAGGYDDQGFRADGMHRNGRFFDNNGRDTYGFNANGRDADNRDWNGLNLENYNVEGVHVSGHLRAGLYEQGPGRILLADMRTVERIRYSRRGMDQLSRFRALPHGPVGAGAPDERFDKDGYNSANQNFLGLGRIAYEANGYDAILQHPDVVGNVGNLYPDDITQLVINFNAQCYDLYDGIVTDDIVDENQIIDAMTAFQYSPYDATTTSFLAVREVKNAQNVNKSPNEIKAALIPYLKKGIFFCNKFLFSGDLTKVGMPDFEHTHLETTSHIITDEMPMPEYERYLAIYQRRHNMPFIDRIKTYLTAQDVLDQAVYTERNDRRAHGHIENPAARGNPDENLGVRAYHISQNLNVYRDRGDGKDFHKSRVYLRILAAHLAQASIDEKAMIAGLFAHGGAHCHDAKRHAVVQSARLLAAQEIDSLEARALDILGNKNIEVAIRSKLYPIKYRKFENMITQTLIARRRNEMLSPLASTWNQFRNQLGLPELENAHALMPVFDPRFPAEFARFFAKEKDITPTNYPDLTHNWDNVIINGGFTKEAILHALTPKMTDLDEDVFKKIMTDVFGPLWVLVKLKTHHVFSNINAVEHPMMTAMLMRYGLLRP